MRLETDPRRMTLVEIHEEMSQLREHLDELQTLGTCTLIACDGQPHQGFHHRHAPKRYAPAGPLQMAQDFDHAYNSRPHLDYLDGRLRRAVADVEAGKNRKLLIEMPPRMGKSQLTTVNMPLWALAKHPDWKIGLVSHSPALATSWGRQVRRMVEEFGSVLDLAIAPDAGSVGEWQTTKGGGVWSRSPGQSVTGLGFKMLLVDDPVKDFVHAHSAHDREELWNWWGPVAQTRLEEPYLLIVIGCLTAESLVLMSDGSERRIDQVRPGDLVVTYSNGELSESVVRNWANQGPDRIYSVTLESGRVVRANGKHPFLTITEGGDEVWKRTDDLTVGECILSVTGASIAASSARSRTALSRPDARDSAPATTTRLDGLPGMAGEPPTKTDVPISGTGTGSTPRTTTGCSRSRVAGAPSATGSRTTGTPEDGTCCSLTTATTPTGCCATTATSSSATGQPSSGWNGPPPTSNTTPDRIVSIEVHPDEDVFDIEVEGTHTFVVNGLVTHNTRWHEDDLLGRILSKEYDGDPTEWEEIRLPALAEKDDILGREPGDPLFSPMVSETRDQALERWGRVQANLGSYTWAALYQQRPAPVEGSIFKDENWKFWTRDPEKVTADGRTVYLDPGEDLAGAVWLDSWDMTFKGKEAVKSDYVVGQRWARLGPNRYLIAQQRDRWSFNETLIAMQRWNAPTSLEDELDRKEPYDPALDPYGSYVHQSHVEEAANGGAVINVMQQHISGIKAVNPRVGKEARARMVTPEVESGHVYLPHPDDPGNGWVSALLDELRDFPSGENDDQVDALTQGLAGLRTKRPAKVASPTSSNAKLPSTQIRAAQKSMLGRGQSRSRQPRIGR